MGEIRHKVLVIEDNQIDQIALKCLVKEQNLPYETTVAGCVAEAKDVLAGNEFDIVLCDYALGDGTAFDVIPLVKEAPIILVTGAGNEQVAVNAWKAGVYDYLVKDFEGDYLKTVPSVIQNALEHRKMKKKVHLMTNAFMNTNKSVYITDLEDTIAFVNKAFCRSYGYEEAEVIGKDSGILWKESDQSSDRRKTYKDADGWEVAFCHKRKDGSEFLVSLTRSIINREDGAEIAVVNVVREVTDIHGFDRGETLVESKPG
jgi:PAS domain S-box-containing protein